MKKWILISNCPTPTIDAISQSRLNVLLNELSNSLSIWQGIDFLGPCQSSHSFPLPSAEPSVQHMCWVDGTAVFDHSRSPLEVWGWMHKAESGAVLWERRWWLRLSRMRVPLSVKCLHLPGQVLLSCWQWSVLLTSFPSLWLACLSKSGIWLAFISHYGNFSQNIVNKNLDPWDI
jgi:hypothetical protein